MTPLGCLRTLFAASPKLNPIMVRSPHHAHAFDLGVEPRVPQNASDILGCLGRFKIEPEKTITGMAQRPFEKVLIAGEEGGLLEMMQERHNVVVTDAEIRHIHADDPAPNAPCSQNVALVERDIFVQQIHAALAGCAVSGPSSSSHPVSSRCTA